MKYTKVSVFVLLAALSSISGCGIFEGGGGNGDGGNGTPSPGLIKNISEYDLRDYTDTSKYKKCTVGGKECGAGYACAVTETLARRGAEGRCLKKCKKHSECEGDLYCENHSVADEDSRIITVCKTTKHNPDVYKNSKKRVGMRGSDPVNGEEYCNDSRFYATGKKMADVCKKDLVCTNIGYYTTGAFGNECRKPCTKPAVVSEECGDGQGCFIFRSNIKQYDFKNIPEANWWHNKQIKKSSQEEAGSILACASNDLASDDYMMGTARDERYFLTKTRDLRQQIGWACNNNSGRLDYICEKKADDGAKTKLKNDLICAGENNEGYCLMKCDSQADCDKFNNSGKWNCTDKEDIIFGGTHKVCVPEDKKNYIDHTH